MPDVAEAAPMPSTKIAVARSMTHLPHLRCPEYLEYSECCARSTTLRRWCVPTVLQQRNVPDAIRRLTTMDPPDYVDLFTVATDRAAERSPEGWARAAIEGAHPAARFLA